MENTPTVSIVIATHNRRQLLQATIGSVLSQTFENWELLVVDDASEDDTWPWLNRLDDSRIRVFRLDQHGERSMARNLGLEEARGEFILFLDDDDLLFASALKVHLTALEEYHSAIGSVGSYVLFDEKDTRRTVKIVRRRRLHDIWQDLLFGPIPVFGQCLFLAQTIRAAGGWSGKFIPIEDHQLWLRISQLGQVVLLHDNILNYRVHNGQWRPRRLWKAMTKVRKHATKKVHGEKREIAERILQARELFRNAENHYTSFENVRALMYYMKTLRLAPRLLKSPLTRPMLLAPMMKCFAGGKRFDKLLQRLARRKEIDYSGCSIVDPERKIHTAMDRKTEG